MEMRETHIPCEPKIEDILYKIGMFAAMNHVTVKTLRFYEERGLLLPAYINDENGYRYYKLSQMSELHRITALKAAGFTLEEISLINSGMDEVSFIQRKRSELLAQIAEMTKQIATLDGYLIDKNGNIGTPILVKTIPETTVAYMSGRIESYDGIFEMMPHMGEIMEKAGCECSLPEYCFTQYLETENKDEDILIEVCQAVTCRKEEMDGLSFKTLPAVDAACAYHRGSYDDLNQTYEEIVRYIEAHGYAIAGPIRESYIDGIWNQESEADWLTEIQIPVTKAIP